MRFDGTAASCDKSHVVSLSVHTVFTDKCIPVKHDGRRVTTIASVYKPHGPASSKPSHERGETRGGPGPAPAAHSKPARQPDPSRSRYPLFPREYNLLINGRQRWKMSADACLSGVFVDKFSVNIKYNPVICGLLFQLFTMCTSLC